ncbi:hypothetical protein FS837_010684 [Tulasnella sp. UAMH 9824]|nr:hypothetical protein FS837_010684 [Tulasnella sp. UAMH 9824]
MSRAAPAPSSFFLEDIVRRKDRDPEGPEDDLAIVLRHWHDSESAPPPPELANDPLNRPLLPGEIGVSYMVTGQHEIAPESDYYLIDRSLQPGDLVKRNVHDVQSGVVLETIVEVKLEHAVSQVQYGGWVASSELENATDVYVGDYIIHNDWVGQVEELFDEAIAELTNKSLFCFAELGGRMQVGDRGPDILPEASLQHLAETTSAIPEVLVSVKPTVLAIAWLAVNQTLDAETAAAKKRPKQFWNADEFKELSIVRPRSILRVSDRVRFKDASLAEMHGVRNTRHGKVDMPGSELIESDILVVRETRTIVRILWQNGVITNDIPSTAVIPYANPDEYDCWPGDWVQWKGEDDSRAGVVTSVFADERTAEVYWRTPPTNPPKDGSKPPAFSIVSVLELDPHGSSTPSWDEPDAIGVRRGDFVLLHREDATNGCVLPRVPKIGELEPWVRDTNPDGWRHEMAHIGMDYAQRFDAAKSHSATPATQQGKLQREADTRLVWKNPKEIGWFGEVISLRTSGDIDLYLASGETVSVPLKRLTLLMDGRDGLPGLWDDPIVIDGQPDGAAGQAEVMSQVLGQFFGIHTANGAGVEDLDEDMGSQGSWEDYDGDGDGMDVDAGDNYQELPPLVSIPEASTEDVTMNAPTQPVVPNPSQEPASSNLPPTPSSPQSPTTKPGDSENEVEDDLEGPWKKFKMLASAPPDHAFLSKKPGQPTRQFMSRLAKEYKMLSTGLPDTIVVRAYEDRADLVRSLIIGPENTPYEGAPFVIDWHFEDTFPQTPPIAHFHSWTNGNGRVNPNLYEEGKVCLSILGTWAGDKAESWSPSRSSLMQALVSIQGLVLVKEPWFCEPAFEKLRGTHEGIVNSRLYSEKAYVLSRSFVRRALEYPPGSLQKEIEWLYLEQGKLGKVIADAKALIEASQTSSRAAVGGGGNEDIMRTIPGWEDKAVPKLTAGGILPLQRTLGKLEAILAEHRHE